MKRTIWVVAVRRDGAWSEMEYLCTCACSALVHVLHKKLLTGLGTNSVCMKFAHVSSK